MNSLALAGQQLISKHGCRAGRFGHSIMFGRGSFAGFVAAVKSSELRQSIGKTQFTPELTPPHNHSLPANDLMVYASYTGKISYRLYSAYVGICFRGIGGILILPTSAVWKSAQSQMTNPWGEETKTQHNIIDSRKTSGFRADHQLLSLNSVGHLKPEKNPAVRPDTKGEGRGTTPSILIQYTKNILHLSL